MYRPTIYSQEVGRSFDILNGWKDALEGVGNGWLAGAGASTAVCTPAALTVTSPASLNLNLGAIQIYQLADVDATPWGALASDTTQIMQQGTAIAQTLTFTTAGMSSGQSQWAVVQCTFEQLDVIPANDPTAGLLPYYNAANPSQPLQGPNNSGATQDTVREALASISIVYGTPTTGTPAVPSASGGNVGLYAVLLTYGQTAINTIYVCNPLIQSAYPYAPFYPGLTGRGPLYSSGSHHHGTAGEAAQINLGTEVTGTAPLTVLPVTDTNPPATGGVVTQGGLIPIEIISNTNPNSNVAGQVGDLDIDSATNTAYWCKTAGSSSTAVWSPLTGGLTPINVTTAPYTALQLQALYTVSYAGNLAFTMASLQSGVGAQVVIVNNNSYTVTVSPSAGQTINGGSSYAFTGFGTAVAFYVDPSSFTNWLAYPLSGELVGTANPNSSVSGSPGQRFYDATHAVQYVCTTGGNASGAVWTRITEAIGSIRSFSPVAAGSNTIPTGYNLCDGGTYNGVTVPNMIGVFQIGSQPTGSSSTPNASGFGNQTVDTTVGATTHAHGIAAVNAGAGTGALGVPFSEITGGTTYIPAAYAVVFICRTL